MRQFLSPSTLKPVAQMLSGIVCLLIALPSALAQPPGALAALRAPGKAAELIAPAQAVIETVHYQTRITLACGSVLCSGAFPRPGAKRRLNVTRIACLISGTSPFHYGYVDLQKADGTRVLSQFLPPDHSTTDGAHTLNRAVDLQVASAQHIRVGLVLAGGRAVTGWCTASGTVDRLQ